MDQVLTRRSVRDERTNKRDLEVVYWRMEKE